MTVTQRIEELRGSISPTLLTADAATQRTEPTRANDNPSSDSANDQLGREERTINDLVDFYQSGSLWRRPPDWVRRNYGTLDNPVPQRHPPPDGSTSLCVPCRLAQSVDCPAIGGSIPTARGACGACCCPGTVADTTQRRQHQGGTLDSGLPEGSSSGGGTPQSVLVSGCRCAPLTAER